MWYRKNQNCQELISRGQLTLKLKTKDNRTQTLTTLIDRLSCVLRRIGNISANLIKVRPLFTLLHRGSDNTPPPIADRVQVNFV